ncbi:MAG: SDR family oxidoreductase [Caldilineaceae bacterium]|nr:SDR family oxidoreductase [Caldilineaceae bacterium]
MLQNLTDKVVLITGASSGIGAATGRQLAAAGAKVALTARSADKLAALAGELGDAAVSIPGDVTDGADVARIVSETLARFGRIDALLANAGVYIPGQFTEGDPEAFAGLMDVNINGVLRCVHAVLPAMQAQRSGDIIVSSSISGFVDIHWEPVYSASKHAIQGFVHTLRRQVAGDGIRVGAVAPGMVANELWGITDEDEIAGYVARHEAIRSDDVAQAILFMLAQPAHVTIRDLVILPQNQDI